MTENIWVEPASAHYNHHHRCGRHRRHRRHRHRRCRHRRRRRRRRRHRRLIRPLAAVVADSSAVVFCFLATLPLAESLALSVERAATTATRTLNMSGAID